MMKRKKKKPDYVEPDLPITPMLDMSFQLLAFFVMTFNPTPAAPPVWGGCGAELCCASKNGSGL